MTELCEGSYKPPSLEKEEDDPKDKEPLTIRMHLLFDGTNNNRTNIAEREKFEVGEGNDSKAHQQFGTKDSSYDNGLTNIAIMEPHIVDGKDKGGYSFVVKVYVEGQGTLNLAEDITLRGKALAIFESGIYRRARKGIDDAFNILVKFLDKKSPKRYFIKQVDIDVFGFSRGAATARHAIHVMTTGETIANHPLLLERFRLRGYAGMSKKRIKIVFAGLYDTVVSVNASQLAPAWLANNARDQ
ncbi:MAG: hypothetical protein GY706_02000, partial [Bacteroides sp.]|nr:hypothetical protein [Bacteroides sp.]